MSIRKAEEKDIERILAVHELAFGQPNEAILVDKLIKAGLAVPELSLVAEIEEIIAGHILMSIVNLDNNPEKQVLALAPLAILPSHQNRGIGSELCVQSVELAKHTEYGAIICLGSARYYKRFGFETASKYGILSPFDVPDELFMVFRLPKFNETLTGRVCYSQPFDQV